jgi:membrane protease YdiL (CAAX protease family)
LACHRLGVIYGRRGYLPQAREMLAKAGSLDPSLSQVCASLALVYSDQPVPPKDAVRMTELLQAQPRWIALLTLGDLAHRVGRPAEQRTLRTAADHELRRFGSAVVDLILIQGGLVLAALLAALVVGIRTLFTREQPSLPWYTHLGWLPWPDVVEVPALMAFCNALGLVGRRALLGGLPADAPLALAARVGHYLLVAVPALALVLVRARWRETDWRGGLGLHWTGVGATLRPALLALGLALVAVPWVSAPLASGVGALLSRLGAAVGAGGGAPGTAVVDLLVAVLLAPLVEEVVFRGFVFRALDEHLHPLLAAGASALLFAAVHVPWDLDALVSLFALGLITAYTYRATRSLWPCIIAHAGYNACVLLAGLILRM